MSRLGTLERKTWWFWNLAFRRDNLDNAGGCILLLRFRVSICHRVSRESGPLLEFVNRASLSEINFRVENFLAALSPNFPTLPPFLLLLLSSFFFFPYRAIPSRISRNAFMTRCNVARKIKTHRFPESICLDSYPTLRF